MPIAPTALTFATNQIPFEQLVTGFDNSQPIPLLSGSFGSPRTEFGTSGFSAVSGYYEYDLDLSLFLNTQDTTLGGFQLTYPTEVDLQLPDNFQPGSSFSVGTNSELDVTGAVLSGNTLSLGQVSLDLGIASSGAEVGDLAFFQVFGVPLIEAGLPPYVVSPFSRTVQLIPADLSATAEIDDFLIDGVALQIQTPGGNTTSSQPVSSFDLDVGSTPLTVNTTDPLATISINPIEALDLIPIFRALDLLTEDFSVSIPGTNLTATFDYTIFAPFISAGFQLVQHLEFTPTSIDTNWNIEGVEFSGVLGDSFEFPSFDESLTTLNGTAEFDLNGQIDVVYTLEPFGEIGASALGASVVVESPTDTISASFGPLFSDSIQRSAGDLSIELFRAENIDIPDEAIPTVITDFTIGQDTTAGSPKDIALLIDISASMQDDIQSVKEQSEEIINAVFESNSDSRISIITFNTLGEIETVLNFTNQATTEERKQAALQGLASVNSSDGGFEPAYGAILSSLNGDAGAFRTSPEVNRQLVLFTDEPPFDTELRDSAIQKAQDLNANLNAPIGPVALVSDQLTLNNTTNSPVATQVFTVLIDGNSSSRVAYQDLATATGGAVVEAADASEVVDALIEVVSLPIYSIESNVETLVEGNSGSSVIVFTLKRDQAGPEAVVDISLGGTVDAQDIGSVPEAVVFLEGQNTVSFQVEVFGDTVPEQDEILILNLTAVNQPAGFSSSSAVVSIQNDDGQRNLQPVILGQEGSNIIVDGANAAFFDFGGFDTYTLSDSLIGDVVITDSDFSRVNFSSGLTIDGARFLNEAVQFDINDNTITFLGSPSSFEFQFGGSPLDQSAGTPANYSSTAISFGTTVPEVGQSPNEATIVGIIQDDGSVGSVAL